MKVEKLKTGESIFYIYTSIKSKSLGIYIFVSDEKVIFNDRYGYTVPGVCTRKTWDGSYYNMTK